VSDEIDAGSGTKGDAKFDEKFGAKLETMIKLGVILLVCTVSVMVAEFLRRRTHPFPAYGWFGLALLAIAESLMFRRVEPLATFFTPIAWTAYALIADAAVFAIRGRSRLRDSPAHFASVAVLSIPLWLVFEAYNLRLANWIYLGGLPLSLPWRWFGYAWAFATIWPGIFLTADLIESFGWWDVPARPIVFSRAAQNTFISAGASLLILPVILPAAIGSFLFGAVWLGFIFLLDPINFRLGLPSLEADLASGHRARFYAFLGSGWVCGWLWEFWNFWAAAQWHYVFPILQRDKIFEMPAPGYLGFPAFALECFVMYYFAAWVLRLERPLALEKTAPREPARATAAKLRWRPFVLLPWLFFALLLGSPSAHASTLHLPDAATHGLDLLYAGRSADAITEFRGVQAADPGSPLGYLLEAEARWWQIYCEACEIKWNTIDAWERPRNASDDGYLALTQKAISIAEARIAQADSAEMRLYAAMGWMFRARLLGLRNDRRATARAGINARAHLLRCLELDPQMADAYTGLGLYNYYADTLSGIARVLRFLMGIPGGSKEEGVRQLQIAIERGEVTQVGARFYLAKNLRLYDHDYARALELLTPLVDEFPRNPLFQLTMGDTQAKLGRNELAMASFRRALESAPGDTACELRIRELAEQSTSALAAASSMPR
jgi:tetratricopeptide (TPR) repeat protein